MKYNYAVIQHLSNDTSNVSLCETYEEAQRLIVALVTDECKQMEAAGYEDISVKWNEDKIVCSISAFTWDGYLNLIDYEIGIFNH